VRDPLAVPSHSHAVLLGASEYGVAHRQPTRTQVLGAGFDGLKIDNCGDDDGSGCAARLARAASAQSRHSYDARVFAQWGACSFVSRVKHLNESGRAILIENSNQAHASAAATAPSINSAALHSWPDRRVRSANSSVASRVLVGFGGTRQGHGDGPPRGKPNSTVAPGTVRCQCRAA
jgi:hypothetical protein